MDAQIGSANSEFTKLVHSRTLYDMKLLSMSWLSFLFPFMLQSSMMELYRMTSNKVEYSWECLPMRSSFPSSLTPENSSKNPKWQDYQNNIQKDAVGGIQLRQWSKNGVKVVLQLSMAKWQYTYFFRELLWVLLELNRIYFYKDS